MLDILFLVCAVVGGTVMVCQFLMTLLGMSDDGGMDADGGDLDAGGGEFDGAAETDLSGPDGSGDHHTTISDASDSEYQHTDSSWLFGLLSFRALVAAMAFFGISGKAALSADKTPLMSLAIATAAGVAAMFGMVWLMRGISRLSSSGNKQIGNALGKPATVYVAIPARGGRAGKVQLTMQNRIVEYPAVTEEEEPLRSGEAVEVVEILSRNLVQVRRA